MMNADLSKQPEWMRAAIVDYDVHAYVEEYEMRGDEGDYSPNEQERGLIKDAIHGAIYEMQQRIVAAFIASQQAEVAGADDGEELREILPFDFEPSDGETGPATISDKNGDIICTLNVEGVSEEWQLKDEETLRRRESAMKWIAVMSRLRSPRQDVNAGLLAAAKEVLALDPGGKPYRFVPPFYNYDAGKDDGFRYCADLLREAIGAAESATGKVKR